MAVKMSAEVSQMLGSLVQNLGMFDRLQITDWLLYDEVDAIVETMDDLPEHVHKVLRRNYPDGYDMSSEAGAN